MFSVKIAYLSISFILRSAETFVCLRRLEPSASSRGLLGLNKALDGAKEVSPSEIFFLKGHEI